MLASRLTCPQDTFEDATETTPRPVSASRSRSLLGRRESSSSTAVPEHTPDSQVPEVPDITAAVTADEKKEHETGPVKGDVEPIPNVTPDTADGDAPKSPTLTSHRISVTSMDDVSLEEGKYPL